jgi:hypothetical protein
MTIGLTTSTTRLNKIFKKCVGRNKNDEVYEKYIRERNKLNSLKRKTKFSYSKNKIYEFKNDGKKLWGVMNELIGKCKNKRDSINYINIEGIKTYNKEIIANAFCKYFNNVGPSLANEIPNPAHDHTYYITNNIPNTIFLNPTDKNEIEKIILKLKNSSSHGHDNISNKYLKLFKSQISAPLEIIFNKSLTEGVFPEKMKLAHVIPVYKAGKKSEVNNYRPIALLACISKVLERIIYNRIYSFLDSNNLLNENQFGFRPGRSTVDAITLFLGNLIKNIENKHYSIGIFIDLSKAFDTLNHPILFYKLQKLGIRGQAYKWIKDYLTNRHQIVKLFNENSRDYTFSETQLVTHGIPQGSILGPLLFIIYVNDIINSTSHGITITYADDTTILVNSDNFEDTYIYAYENLVSIIDWFNANKLSINLTKTNYILFTPNNRLNEHIPDLIVKGVQIKKVDCVKFLGIYLDNKLNWEFQVNNIVNKINQAHYFFKSIKNIIPDSHKKMLYYAHVYSCLNYGTLLWGPMLSNEKKRKLSKMQDKIISNFTCHKNNRNINESYKTLKLLKLEDIIDFELSKFAFQLANNTIILGITQLFPNQAVQTRRYNTRNRNVPYIARHTSKHYNNSFLTKTSMAWTKLNNNVKTSNSKYAFKKRFISFKTNSY